MTDFMAQMLNELMGPQRNALPGEVVEVDFDHPDVCRDFLVGFCLNDAFRNTKNDLGYCHHQIHDESLRKKYKESNRYFRLGYEDKFLERIRRMHHEVRKKIEKNEARLAVTQGDSHVSTDPFERRKSELEDKKVMLGKRVEELMEEAQLEGERGNVAAAQTAVEKADELTKERAAIDMEELKIEEDRMKAIAMEDHVTAGNKQMQVCQVCGCFMLTNDAQQRIDDHLSGKLHIAYSKIKEHLDIMEKAVDEHKKAMLKEREDRLSDRTRRDTDREKSREKRDRSRERDSRDSRGGHGGRGGSGYQRRDSYRDDRRDDRGRDRRDGGRDRDRDRRDRSRSRDRKRDRDRR